MLTKLLDFLFGLPRASGSGALSGIPLTSRPLGPLNQEDRPHVFDPAVRQYIGAFRLVDPHFKHPSDAARWREARRQMLDHVLRLCVESRWRDNLMLRGSRLLMAWQGAAARHPGDLDWVIVPQSIGMGDPWSKAMLQGLAQSIVTASAPRGIELLGDRVAIDEIWTYERVPGCRLVFPWRMTGLPPGAVQCDFVFGEPMASAPIMTRIPLVDGRSISALCASPEQSLAWKILWLVSDMHAQGKDLYDAVLLAEQTRLPFELLKRTLELGGELRGELTLESLDLDDIDWENFRIEVPEVQGTGADWLARLKSALKPTFDSP